MSYRLFVRIDHQDVWLTTCASYLNNAKEEKILDAYFLWIYHHACQNEFCQSPRYNLTECYRGLFYFFCLYSYGNFIHHNVFPWTSVIDFKRKWNRKKRPIWFLTPVLNGHPPTQYINSILHIYPTQTWDGLCNHTHDWYFYYLSIQCFLSRRRDICTIVHVIEYRCHFHHQVTCIFGHHSYNVFFLKYHHWISPCCIYLILWEIADVFTTIMKSGQL